MCNIVTIRNGKNTHVYSIHNFICLLMTTIYVDVQTIVQFCTEAATLSHHELQVAQTEPAQDFYGAARSCGTPENTDYHSQCLQYNFLLMLLRFTVWASSAVGVKCTAPSQYLTCSQIVVWRSHQTDDLLCTAVVKSL